MGNIWDDAEPQFNNYTYDYQVRHTHVAIKGKLLSDRGYSVIPWVSGSLGVGVQRHLNPPWQAGIGYEFVDWGKSQLSRASGQSLNNGLSLSHLYTNGFLLNLTYLA